MSPYFFQIIIFEFGDEGGFFQDLNLLYWFFSFLHMLNFLLPSPYFFSFPLQKAFYRSHVYIVFWVLTIGSTLAQLIITILIFFFFLFSHLADDFTKDILLF